jgi:hypothetical protein
MVNVAIKPSKGRNEWVVGKVVISGRPPLPSKRGMQTYGGKSFHHETAWFVEEYLLARKWEGKSLAWVYQQVQAQAGDELWPADDAVGAIYALNEYFTTALTEASSGAVGHLGSARTHSRQGGDISARMREVRAALESQDQMDWVRGSFYIYLATFEAEPGLGKVALTDARQAHVARINELFAEYDVDPEAIARAHEIVAEHWDLPKPAYDVDMV